MKYCANIFIVFFSLLLTACGITEIEPDEHAKIMRRDVPEYNASKTIFVKNKYAEPVPVSIQVNDSSDIIKTDLQKYTRSAVKLLTRGLEKRDVYSDSSSKKTITLHVHDVNYSRKNYWTAGLSITADLSNGNTITVSDEYFARANLGFTVNRSVSTVIKKLTHHPDFIAYINN